MKINNIFSEIYHAIMLQNPSEKCTAVAAIANLEEFGLDHYSATLKIDTPGLPTQLVLVAPRELKRRGMQKQEGRNRLMHAVAHIEFNAINLALDAAYRFRNQPMQFYRDWISIAADEARHFQLIREYLKHHNCDYGDYPAHNGLWEMAVQTADDVVARMALVPRVLEARGLDVTPGMIAKLENVGDTQAVEILRVIYKDEIQHVKTGSKWFAAKCEERALEPRATFKAMVQTHLHGELKGPFNIAARLQAGFDQIELNDLEMVT